MESMMAIRAHARGGPEVLRYEEAPRPVAGIGEVLVEVHAAAVTPGELSWDARLAQRGRNGSDADDPLARVLRRRRCNRRWGR
jgi:hypothetical protein